MRNVLAHGYYKLPPSPLWEVVRHDLPPLNQQVTHYLKEVNREEWEKNEIIIAESAVHKNLVQTARRMKKDSMDARQISRYTGLSVEEIEAL